MTDDGNVHHLPAHRRGTGFEHMTNDDFMIAAFGPEALAICKNTSPKALERVWLKPIDPARGNGRLFYEVGNRGGKSMLVTFQKAAGSHFWLTSAVLWPGLF